MFSNAVSRISALKVINNVAITNACRRGAEYDLWKSNGLEWTNATETERQVLAVRCRAYPKFIISK